MIEVFNFCHFRESRKLIINKVKFQNIPTKVGIKFLHENKINKKE